MRLLFVGIACHGASGTAVPPGSDSSSTTESGGHDTADSETGGRTDDDADGSPEGEDCDDADSAVHPDAEEVCNGADDDCDGVVDGEGAAGCEGVYADADGDGVGTGDVVCLCPDAADGLARSGGDCDDDNPHWTQGCEFYAAGTVAIVVATAGTHLNGMRPARSEGVWNGVELLAVHGATGWIDRDDVRLATLPGSPEAFGDFDGDGLDDAVGHLSSDCGSTGCQYDAYVWPGPFDHDVETGEAIASWRGVESVGIAPDGATFADDVDGDGVQDLLAMVEATEAGELRVVRVPDDAAGDVAGWPTRVSGLDAGTWHVLVASDVDGDGVDDLLVESWSDDTHRLMGPLDEASSLADADARYEHAVATETGDFDGDGDPDWLFTDNDGVVFSVDGLAGSGLAADVAFATIDVGTEWGERYGGKAAGDVDADGTPDVLVSAWGSEAGEPDQVWVFRGPLAGTLGVGDEVAGFTHPVEGDDFGSALALGIDGRVYVEAYNADLGMRNGGAIFVFDAH
ncbi:MAG: putative metal-binding motif-containing protein [Myxococcota bacterium]